MPSLFPFAPDGAGPSILLGVVVGLVVCQLALFTTTVYLHRALSHRALSFGPVLRAAFRVITWMTTGIVPRQWVAVHRTHHAHTDVEGDPHSPVLLGWGRVQLTNVSLYRAVATDATAVERYARDLPADRWDRALFDRSALGLGLGITLLVVLIGPLAALVAAVLHAVLYLQLNAAVNAIGHHFGRRPHPNTATNLQWLALLTQGEGLHNNHHAAPTSARLSFRRGEVDPAWPVIAAFRRLGWASVRHEGPRPRRAPATSR